MAVESKVVEVCGMPVRGEEARVSTNAEALLRGLKVVLRKGMFRLWLARM